MSYRCRKWSQEYVFAGEDAVAEAAEHAEHFVVSETGFENDLRDDIGRRIKGVIGVEVVEPAADSRRTQQEVVSVVMAGQSCLRVFHRYGEPDLVAEVLGYAPQIGAPS